MAPTSRFGGSRRTSDGQARTGQTTSDARRPSDKLSLLVKAAARLAAEQARQEPELAGLPFACKILPLAHQAGERTIAFGLARRHLRERVGRLGAQCPSRSRTWPPGVTSC